MGFGCLASLAFYAAILTLLIPNGIVPLLIILGTFTLITLRWLRSDWPLY